MYKELVQAILSKYFGVRFYRIVEEPVNESSPEPESASLPVGIDTPITPQPPVDSPSPPTDFDPLAIDPMPQPQKGKRKRK